MKLYKLTDGDGQTQNGTQWGPGVSHSGTGEGELCGPGWIHAYEHPLIAVLLNPIHANFKNTRMWEAEGEIAIRDGQLKCGCATLTTIREIPLPEITAEMRVRFAILCAKYVRACSAWNAWADNWLSGEDRSAEAAAVASRAAYDASRSAYDVETWAAEAAAAAAYRSARASRAAHDVETWAAEAAASAVAYRSAYDVSLAAHDVETWSAEAAYRSARAVETWAAEAAAAAAYRSARASRAAETAASAAYRSTRSACCGMDLAAIAEKACAKKDGDG